MYILFLFQTWDLLLIMYHGFKGLSEDFIKDHPHHFISPVRINGSAIESIFSSLKYISGGNLSSVNYATSLSSLLTVKDIKKAQNRLSEDGYRTDINNIH